MYSSVEMGEYWLPPLAPPPPPPAVVAEAVSRIGILAVSAALVAFAVVNRINIAAAAAAQDNDYFH